MWIVEIKFLSYMNFIIIYFISSIKIQVFAHTFSATLYAISTTSRGLWRLFSYICVHSGDAAAVARRPERGTIRSFASAGGDMPSVSEVPVTRDFPVWSCSGVTAAMGKKNSKLKQDTIDRLTTATYCECFALVCNFWVSLQEASIKNKEIYIYLLSIQIASK